MRVRNKKGFTGIEIVFILCALGIVGYFAVPQVGKAVNNIFTGNKNQQKASYKVSEQYSMFYKDDKGNYKPAPIPYKRTEESLNYTNAEPPETLWQKFWHLGAMAVVIIMLLSYVGILPIIRLWWSKKIKPKLDQAEADLENLKEQQEQLSGDAKLIVRSVDEGLSAIDSAIASAQMALNTATALPDSPAKSLQLSLAQAVLTAVTGVKKEFLNAMSRKQNNTTKLLVAELKND